MYLSKLLSFRPLFVPVLSDSELRTYSFNCDRFLRFLTMPIY